MAYCVWDLTIHLARYEAALIAQVSIENDAVVLRRGRQRTDAVDDWHVTWAAAESNW